MRVIVNTILVTLHTMFRSFKVPISIIVNICTLYCIIPIIGRFSEELSVQDNVSHHRLNLFFGLWCCNSKPNVGTKHDLTVPGSTWQAPQSHSILTTMYGGVKSEPELCLPPGWEPRSQYYWSRRGRERGGGQTVGWRHSTTRQQSDTGPSGGSVTSKQT